MTKERFIEIAIQAGMTKEHAEIGWNERPQGLMEENSIPIDILEAMLFLLLQKAQKDFEFNQAHFEALKN